MKRHWPRLGRLLALGSIAMFIATSSGCVDHAGDRTMRAAVTEALFDVVLLFGGTLAFRESTGRWPVDVLELRDGASQDDAAILARLHERFRLAPAGGGLALHRRHDDRQLGVLEFDDASRAGTFRFDGGGIVTFNLAATQPVSRPATRSTG